MGSCCVGVSDPNQKSMDEAAKNNKNSNQGELKIDEPRDIKQSLSIDIGTAFNQISVYVIQGRNLPKYDVTSSDPYVTVTIGKNKYVHHICRDLNPVWNTCFKEQGVGLLKKVNHISFEVFDHDRMTKDDLMGTFTINVPSEYEFSDDALVYNTPVQWIPLRESNTKKPVRGEIQVQLKFVVNAELLNIRYFTHILELNIKQAAKLHDMDFLGKSDPYCKVEWGGQAYKTATKKTIKNAVDWNETVFLFVHEQFQDKYWLKFMILDEDYGHDDTMGTAYITANDLFDKVANSNVDSVDIPLEIELSSVNFDKSVSKSLVTTDDQKSKGGQLIINCALRNRKAVEKPFVNALFEEFDLNNDQKLEKEEVEKMIAFFNLENNDFNAEQMFNTFDKDYDQVLTKEEVIVMFSDAKFQQSPMCGKMIKKFLLNSLSRHERVLMKPFDNVGHGNTSKVINVLHRHTGLIVQEFIPGYVWYALKMMYNFKLGSALTHISTTHKILDKMSRKKGVKMDLAESTKEIKPFMNNYGIDELEFAVKNVDEFKSFNDFFARAIDHEKYRPMVKDPDVIVSPADCRMMVFPSILDTSVWIKGAKFTVETLLGERKALLNQNGLLSNGSFFIARLAPQDYHRWHYPVSGIVKAITPIDGALLTVNPIAINKKVNVYTENKRCVIEIDAGPKIGYVVMFPIAATMVGSYNLFSDGTKPLEVGDKVRRGDVAGEFRFGGSTVLNLFEAGRVKFDDDLLLNSSKQIETLMAVRDRVGRIQPRNHN